MSTPDKAGSLVYALAPLAAVLATALVLQGWRGSHAAAILNTPPSNITFSQPPHALNLTDDLQIIQERPLFYATRKFYDPVLPAPPTTRSQLSSYQLMGTLLLPQRPGVAFLRTGPAGETTTLSPGDHLDGWTVEAVHAGSAVFGYADQRVTLTTTLAFGNSSTAQSGGSGGIVRIPIGRPAQHQASAAQVSREPIRPSPHRPYSPRDHTRGP